MFTVFQPGLEHPVIAVGSEYDANGVTMTTTSSLFHYVTDFKFFSAGQVIFKEGQPGDIMYFVIDGTVDLLVHDTIVDSIGPGGVLGEMMLIDTQPRSATAIAKTDCKLVPIDEKTFIFLVQLAPHFAVEVMRTMAERLRHMNTML